MRILNNRKLTTIPYTLPSLIYESADRGTYKRVEMRDLSEAIESGALTADGDDELDDAEQDGN